MDSSEAKNTNLLALTVIGRLVCILIAMMILSSADSPDGSNSYESSVIGGARAAIESYPWTVAIYKSGGSLLGTGVAIGDRWILTAAHVVEGEIFTIHADEDDIGPNNNNPRGRWLFPRETHIHEDYRPDIVDQINPPGGMDQDEWDEVRFGHDLALIELRPGDRMTHFIPFVGAADTRIEEGQVVQFTGWGETENGPATHLHVGTNELRNIRELIIIADQRQGTNALAGEGDSGGPVVVDFNEDGNELLVAIVVAADQPDGNATTVFARVDAHADWIGRITGILPIRQGGTRNNNTTNGLDQLVGAIGLPMAANANMLLDIFNNPRAHNAQDPAVRMEPERQRLIQDEDEEKEEAVENENGLRRRGRQASKVDFVNCQGKKMD